MKKKFIELFNYYKRPLIMLILLTCYQGGSYALVKFTPFKYHVLGSPLDDAFPFMPFWSIFYVSWHVLLFLGPLYFYTKNRKMFYWYLAVNIVVDTIAIFIFFFYPTLLVRPDIEVTGLFTFLVKFMYIIDTPALNCLPSIHCTTCFIAIFALIKTKGIDIKARVLGILMSCLIIFSTFFIKQHVIADAIAAFALVCFSSGLVLITKMDDKLLKKLDS